MPFADRTSNKDDYIRHELPNKFYRPKEEYKQNKIPIDSLTTTRRDYVPKDMEKARSFKPENKGIGSDAPFESDTTTSKSDFKLWPVEPMVKRAGAEWKPPVGQMESITNYSTDFSPRVAYERVQPLKPINREKITAKFEGDPTYKGIKNGVKKIFLIRFFGYYIKNIGKN